MDAIEVLPLLREWTGCGLFVGRDELRTARIHVRLVAEDGLGRPHIWTEIVNSNEIGAVAMTRTEREKNVG